MHSLLTRLFLCVLLLVCSSAKAQVTSEQVLVGELFRSLQYNDPERFEKLFPGVDTLASWVLQHADKSSLSYRKMYSVANSPYYREEYDSTIRKAAYENFRSFLYKAKKLKIYWGETVFLRYELEENKRKRGLLSGQIASLRFKGYVFFKDQLSQKIYCFSITDIMQVNGKWYGGELVDLHQAESVEQFKKAQAKELRRLKLLAAGDSTALASYDGEENEEDYEYEWGVNAEFKEIAQRKYYEGKFDNEIKVELYVRYIKGPCDGGACAWEALFLFGDEEAYVPMSVTKTPEGVWIFTEELGTMELTLKDETYRGTYTSSSDKTEYDVVLKLSPIKPRKLLKLDSIIEYKDPDEDN